MSPMTWFWNTLLPLVLVVILALTETGFALRCICQNEKGVCAPTDPCDGIEQTCYTVHRISDKNVETMGCAGGWVEETDGVVGKCKDVTKKYWTDLDSNLTYVEDPKIVELKDEIREMLEPLPSSKKKDRILKELERWDLTEFELTKLKQDAFVLSKGLGRQGGGEKLEYRICSCNATDLCNTEAFAFPPPPPPNGTDKKGKSSGARDWISGVVFGTGIIFVFLFAQPMLGK